MSRIAATTRHLKVQHRLGFGFVGKSRLVEGGRKRTKKIALTKKTGQDDQTQCDDGFNFEIVLKKKNKKNQRKSKRSVIEILSLVF